MAMSPWMHKRAALNALSIALLFLSLLSTVVSAEQKSAVPSELTHMPTKCESCMLFSRELDNAVARLPPKMVRPTLFFLGFDKLSLFICALHS
jgi:hypothetical protein